MKKTKKIFVEINLPVTIFKEGKRFIAYTPALDLSTSGKTFKETKKRFKEVVDIFLEETLRQGTLEKALLELGWRKIKKKWIPPMMVAHETEKVKFPALA